MVAETFTSLVLRYSNNIPLSQKLYNELVRCYSQKSRHYHNLDHLHHILLQLSPFLERLSDPDAVLFAVYYHDSVYNSLRKDNEQKSAELASRRLALLKLPHALIESCKRHILATKAHDFSNNPDTNFFTDADLSILGQDWPSYKVYSEAVRKEYNIYPDLIYKPGRLKVIERFLQMDKIFKTDQFFKKYEQPARLNLKREQQELIN